MLALGRMMMKLSERMLARAERMRKRGHRAYAMFLRRDAGKVAQLEEENAALKRLLTSMTCGECDETMLDCTCPDTKSLLTAEESE